MDYFRFLKGVHYGRLFYFIHSLIKKYILDSDNILFAVIPQNGRLRYHSTESKAQLNFDKFIHP